MTPAQKLKEIEELAEDNFFIDNPNKREVDERISWLISRVKQLESVIKESLELDLCHKTSCPYPMRAMCNNDSHKIRYKALEGEE